MTILNLMINSNLLLFPQPDIHPGPAVGREELPFMVDKDINILVEVKDELKDTKLDNTVWDGQGETSSIVVIISISYHRLITYTAVGTDWEEDCSISLEGSL